MAVLGSLKRMYIMLTTSPIVANRRYHEAWAIQTSRCANENNAVLAFHLIISQSLYCAQYARDHIRGEFGK